MRRLRRCTTREDQLYVMLMMVEQSNELMAILATRPRDEIEIEPPAA